MKHIEDFKGTQVNPPKIDDIHLTPTFGGL